MAAAVDGELRALCASGEHRVAATRGLNLYGAEITSYLVASLRDQLEVKEAFSLFCMALWEALPRFRWECSLRTWLYALARHAIQRVARERGRARQAVTLTPEVEQIAASVRSATPSYLKTGARRRIEELRADLDPEDRELLILRVNRNLAWDEVARVLLDSTDEPTPEEIARKAAAVRKRFERLKASLKQRAGR